MFCFCSKRSFRFLFVAISFAVFLIWPSASKANVEFENELRHLFSRELGHTLIGAKPVSDEEWFWYRSTSHQLKEMTIDFLKSAFANSKTFILKTYSPRRHYLGITLIHKPLLIKTIREEKYLKFFILRNYGSIENFIKTLVNSRESIFEILKFDDMALGLIFGYGRSNSSYASRRMEIQDFLYYEKNFCGYFLRPIPRPETITIAGFCTLPPPCTVLPKRSIKLSSGFHSLEVELEYLDSLEHKTQEFGPPYLFEPPFFIAKRCPETDRLIAHYKKSTNKLAKIYLKKPFSQFLAEQMTR